MPTNHSCIFFQSETYTDDDPVYHGQSLLIHQRQACSCSRHRFGKFGFPFCVPADEDLFLICSDGLSDMLTDDQIEEVLHQEPTAINLIEAAKAAGGRDNVSVVLLRVTE